MQRSISPRSSALTVHLPHIGPENGSVYFSFENNYSFSVMWEEAPDLMEHISEEAFTMESCFLFKQ